jgi:hypothetical protein
MPQKNRFFRNNKIIINLSKSDSPKPRLLEQIRGAIRLRHYSYRTEQCYIHWIKRFIFFITNCGHTALISNQKLSNDNVAKT